MDIKWQLVYFPFPKIDNNFVNCSISAPYRQSLRSGGHFVSGLCFIVLWDLSFVRELCTEGANQVSWLDFLWSRTRRFKWKKQRHVFRSMLRRILGQGLNPIGKYKFTNLHVWSSRPDHPIFTSNRPCCHLLPQQHIWSWNLPLSGLKPIWGEGRGVIQGPIRLLSFCVYCQWQHHIFWRGALSRQNAFLSGQKLRKNLPFLPLMLPLSIMTINA